MPVEFPKMVKVVPEGVRGIASVEHFEITKFNAQMSAILDRQYYVTEGRYARLRVDGQVYMSDARWEHRSNWEVVRRAHGDVLIAGLGLGMILHPILKKPEVTSVRVLEKYGDVIELIRPTLRSRKLALECADVFEWKPAKGAKFHTIYFDIWADMSTEDLAQQGKLHQRGKFWLDRSDPDCWMNSWNRENLLAQKREEARRAW